uniref:Uncharacterized protein n=1 Tax=Dromaius novaehollandiae TaxID=8790 RepID=A0A8C4JNP5_DRONO
MAEDDGLADGDAAVDVAQGPVLGHAVLAHQVVLPHGAEGQLLLAQLDDDGGADELRGERPHRRLEGGREEQHLAALGSLADRSPLDANALAGEALLVDHDVGLVQHEHSDVLRVEHVALEAPVQHRAGRPDDDLLLGAEQRDADVDAEPPHLLHHAPDLQGQLEGGGQAEALGRQSDVLVISR